MEGEKSIMTIQQAAELILKERKKPLKSKEIATIALNNKLVQESMAKDPVQSLSQTIERNIRMNQGNSPQLIFTSTESGRCIALPEWQEELNKQKEDYSVQLIEIPLLNEIMDKVRLYENSKSFSNTEEAIIDLIKKGLISSSNEILEKLKAEFENL